MGVKKFVLPPESILKLKKHTSRPSFVSKNILKVTKAGQKWCKVVQNVHIDTDFSCIYFVSDFTHKKNKIWG